MFHKSQLVHMSKRGKICNQNSMEQYKYYKFPDLHQNLSLNGRVPGWAFGTKFKASIDKDYLK